MGIAEFLDAPDGAVLVAINGEVELVTTRHETPTRLVVERFPLGPVASIDAVMALMERAAPAPMPAAPQPTLAAPEHTGALACPECGRAFQGAQGLGSHRSAAHGVAGKLEHTRKTPAKDPPPVAQHLPPIIVSMGNAVETTTALRAADPRGMCDACGMPNRNHLVCEECARRIGPGHTVEVPARQHRGKTWCADCVEVLRQQTAYNGKAARV